MNLYVLKWQNHVFKVGNSAYKDPLDCLKDIYKKNGLKGIFRGLNLTILREVPAFSSYFLTYELLTRRNDDLPVTTFNMLMGGGFAGKGYFSIFNYVYKMFIYFRCRFMGINISSRRFKIQIPNRRYNVDKVYEFL